MTHGKWGMFGSGGDAERILGLKTLATIDQLEAEVIEKLRGPSGLEKALAIYDGVSTPETFALLPRGMQEDILQLASLTLTRLSVAASQQENT